MIPKFRAYSTEENKMYYPHNDKNVDWTIDNETGFIAPSVNLGDGMWGMIDKYKLMQSTGLKGYMSDSFEDAEEKDVFRGDIIDIFWEEWPMGYYQENHIVGVVDLDETGTAWIIKDAKYEYDTPKTIPSEIDGISVSMSLPDEEDLEEIFLHAFDLSANDITILGNIYENSDLLEAE
ncbi:YopX family protein [Enterococcus thailandicus]|uniref:YopX family protein n=1 Tax=Enterococcus thailandicus TaxID=417368 RepID=UPI00288E3CD1|nr:YopX family protein [Enterococcus thailandicus]MDT2794281.1 YopX family protein [Enterococcus thailandicus]